MSRAGERPTVGFIGLGRMGVPMARNLARAGFPLVLHNRTRAKAETLAGEIGAAASVAAQPRDVAARAALVVTMLADDDAACEVYSGAAGLLAAADGRTLIEMSTVSPDHVRALNAEVRAAGGVLIDAPVSGSVDAAQAAQLLIMAGGEAVDLARARPLLDAMGRAVLPTGPVGSAAYMKIVVNTIIFGLNQTVAEALILAEAGGIAAARAYEVIENSAACAPMLRYRKPQYLDEANSPVSFTLGLADKDMRLALDLAASGGRSLPQIALNRAVLHRAIAAGYGARDMAAVLAYLRADATQGEAE